MVNTMLQYYPNPTPEERKKSKLVYDQRTQANYYYSSRYPDGLTQDLVQSHQPNQPIKNGQVPFPLNRWTPFDGWYLTNNWFHKINERTPFCLFSGWLGGLHCTEFYDQPYKGHLNFSQRKYEDNIVAQTIGAGMIGLQLGFGFGILHTWNLSRVANIHQGMSMMPSTWMPIHKADFRFKIRVWTSCMIQCSTFLAAYALVDGAASQLRQKDDIWNPMFGGMASGAVLVAWFRNPYMSFGGGLTFGAFMAWFRFFSQPDGHPKPAFDLERPLWGVLGGFRTWIYGLEPNPDQYVWQWWDRKYRTS